MFKDMGQALRQAREMQQKMQAIQEELARQEVTGQAGGGMVQVTLNGRNEIVRVRIDPNAAMGDSTQLEDLVTSAFRDAHKQVQEVAKRVAEREMGPLAGLLGGIPGL